MINNKEDHLYHIKNSCRPDRIFMCSVFMQSILRRNQLARVCRTVFLKATLGFQLDGKGWRLTFLRWPLVQHSLVIRSSFSGILHRTSCLIDLTNSTREPQWTQTDLIGREDLVQVNKQFISFITWNLSKIYKGYDWLSVCAFTKVGDLGIHVAIQQYIFRLEVSVHHHVSVAVINRWDDLLEKTSGLRFLHLHVIEIYCKIIKSSMYSTHFRWYYRHIIMP